MPFASFGSQPDSQPASQPEQTASQPDSQPASQNRKTDSQNRQTASQPDSQPGLRSKFQESGTLPKTSIPLVFHFFDKNLKNTPKTIKKLAPSGELGEGKLLSFY